MTNSFMNYPKTRLRKWVFKAPIHLWRMGLAPLIGNKMVLMTHIGRKSQQPRRTMAEFHRLNGKKYVPCAFGAKAQWYKNMAADPHVTVQSADGIEPMLMQRVTDDGEIADIVSFILKKNPVMMKAHLKALGIRPNRPDIIAQKDKLYMLRFDPTTERTPPPMPSDLLWIWPVAAMLLTIVFVLRRKS